MLKFDFVGMDNTIKILSQARNTMNNAKESLEKVKNPSSQIYRISAKIGGMMVDTLNIEKDIDIIFSGKEELKQPYGCGKQTVQRQKSGKFICLVIFAYKAFCRYCFGKLNYQIN